MSRSARWQHFTLCALAAIFLAASLGRSAAASSPPHVVVTVKPLHSLTAQVMADVAEPILLIEGATSPHVYSMRPSDALALKRADIVIWTGEALETFFLRMRAGMDADTEIITVRDLPGITILRNRAASGEAGDGEPHGPVDWDPHLWLDLDNAAAVVAGLAARLADRDPAHAERYIANRDRALQALEALKDELIAGLSGREMQSYVAAHDAYQYFEGQYGLRFAGAVLAHPGRPTSARHLTRLRRRVEAGDIACLLTEPQFHPPVVDMLAAETGLRIVEADPLGTTLQPGPDLYPRLMRALAAALESCLIGAG